LTVTTSASESGLTTAAFHTCWPCAISQGRKYSRRRRPDAAETSALARTRSASDRSRLIARPPELAENLFAAGAGLYGPDWINVQTRRSRPAEEADWFDLTTPRGWGKHVKKYRDTFGKGIAIIWNSTVGGSGRAE
jgi:hypothetical protein